ncbi:hypothetical protein M406DRAFT_339394 [Cryphonectria parasitica EP155]|uniref:Uncharacterized protein n=1 Tax=Cryphonectria parasitica (strain ATCC 38755 / EP155) TaxID=660469 RepID=A0A9P4Y4P2_CRYP1|nr:uncharacterized protein M406DRAFT_339394 [Cryphonectria parasitica EP155]KAF3766110.1 hypothetical protein M406DRAFT_339394 [Cryphonectria parasitica EP155]
MLTINKPVQYGYKSIHDLPTPPNTSRPSPPLMYQESQKPLALFPRSRSPPSQLMSGSYRGLPPPAAMSSGQPLPPGSHSQPPPPSGGPASQQQQQHLGQLPPPPGWQSSEDAMRAWLHAKAEEEKRRQEEERTNQERFRLEQRKTEFEILRASLQGGIPPPMVPVVFAGMGGATLPPAALDWAQQFAQQVHQQQLLPGPASPRHRRDSHPQAYGHYQGSGAVPSTPGSGQGVHGSFVGGYPASPRTRGYTVPASGSRPLPGGSGLASLNTSVLPSSGGTVASQSHPGAGPAQQQESQQSPSIYFHMWQPPSNQNSQAGSNQPSTPSVGESPRKRKAAGPQQAAPAPSTQQRFRSPPFSQSTSSTVSNPPPGRRRGHSRQTSDGSTTYRRGRAETIGSSRGMSPLSNSGTVAAGRETAGTPAEPSSFTHQPPTAQTRNVAHSTQEASQAGETPNKSHHTYQKNDRESEAQDQQLRGNEGMNE